MNKAARNIQRNVRGSIVRRAMKLIQRSVSYIQGYFKMKWLSASLKLMRSNSIMIQRAIRGWLLYKKIVKERLNDFFEKDQIRFENRKMAEHLAMFGQFIKSKLPPEILRPENTQGAAQLVDLIEYGASLNQIREIDPYAPKKVALFMKVIDIDVLTDLSEIYDPLWSIQALKLQYETTFKNYCEVQLLDVGDFHTIAVTDQPRVYSWGLNDSLQLGRPKSPFQSMLPCEQIGFPSAGFKPQQIASGEEHNLLLEHNTNNLLVWGSNSKGQHGLGHTNEVSNINVLDFDRSNPIIEVRAKATQSLVIVQSGAVYTWPYEKASGEMIYSPVELTLPPKIQIITASCGYNFTMLVSKSGLVFSYGKENTMGQLGHGDRIPRRSPSAIAGLQNLGEKIVQISCGYRHTICKTSLGKVFTWGSGRAGQLGNESFDDELEPVSPLVSSKHSRVRVIQVQAGFRHSAVMLETRKMVWTGTNGSISETNKFVEADLTQKVSNYTNSIDITPLKIFTAWSKTISLTYVTFADSRNVELGSQAKAKVITTLAQHIEENRAYSNIDLPYIPTIFNHFTNKVMPFVPEKKIATIRVSDKSKIEKVHNEAAKERAKLAGTKYEKKSQSTSKQRVFEPAGPTKKDDIDYMASTTPEKMLQMGSVR